MNIQNLFESFQSLFSAQHEFYAKREKSKNIPVKKI